MPPFPDSSATARSRPDDATWRGSAPAWWPWGLGVLVGLVVIGPGLGAGPLLSLDLLVTPEISVPNGIYGLGPGLSQRVPLFALFAAGSALVGGPLATKALLVAFIAVGFAGAARLARLFGAGVVVVGPLAQVAAAVLWAAGPFALTRIGAGHLNLLWVVAVLPWALPRLCRPAAHLPSTFLASLALAVGGPGGGTLGLAIAVVALVLTPRPRRIVRPLVAIVVPQAIWVAPTAVLLWAGAGVSGAGSFATVLGGAARWPAVAAGDGFWRADFQVGPPGWVFGLVGLGVAVLAVVGGVARWRVDGWASWSVRASAVAVVGLVLALASAVAGVRDAYGWVSDLPVGAPLRESQRFLVLWLVWAAPASALGASVIGRWVRERAPAATPVPAVVLGMGVAAVSVPGWWGVEGRLEPTRFPDDWAVAAQVIGDEPGTVVAFPWSEYPPLGFAAGRQVFNPLPEYLGGDVISSYDPAFDPGGSGQEQVDRRADVVDGLSDQALAGEPIGYDLADLGVRWVFVTHEPGGERYGSLVVDPGLDRRLALADLDLYEVRGWEGQAVDPTGTGHDVQRPLPPLLRTDAPDGSILNVAGAPGWVRGWFDPVAVTDDGRLRIDGAGGLIWFWPAPLLVALDASVLAMALWAIWARRDRFGRILAQNRTRG